jgi:ubiquinone/menaquinone biosynthesis C-methylase UbiE
MDMRKPKKIIKKELASQYFGKEAEIYDAARSEDPRRRAVIDIQKKITQGFLKDAGGNNILDVACGTGRFFELYGNRKIYGIDISPEMLKQAAKRKGVKKVMTADAENIPFKNDTFDVVNTSQFIMHTPFYRKVIKEMTRVAKKNGSIIIDFPNKFSLSYFFTKRRIATGTFRHYNLFTLSEIKDIARENNLKIREIRPTVVFSPMLFPESWIKFSMGFNALLTKIVPSFAYVRYVHFIKQ